jgi:hypothetical protein
MPISTSRRRVLAWGVAAAVVLVAANVVVAGRVVGTRAGQTYVWVCRESGAELSYNPSVFAGPGRSRLVPGATPAPGGHRWEQVAPRRSDPRRPWNWLAWLLDQPTPDPEAVIRQERLGPD